MTRMGLHRHWLSPKSTHVIHPSLNTERRHPWTQVAKPSGQLFRKRVSSIGDAMADLSPNAVDSPSDKGCCFDEASDAVYIALLIGNSMEGLCEASLRVVK